MLTRLHWAAIKAKWDRPEKERERRAKAREFMLAIFAQNELFAEERGPADTGSADTREERN